MAKTILITGGAGYIGSQLIRDLATEPDTTIRIYDNMQRETYVALLDLPSNGSYEFIEGDILDQAALGYAMRDVGAVIHMAAMVRTPFAFGPRGWLEQINHWGTVGVANAAVEAGVKLFIYPSSASVYGPFPALRQPFQEDDSPRPYGLYAESKFRAEHALQKQFQRRSMEVIILRLATVFGLAPATRFDAVANRFAYLAGVGRALPVTGDDHQLRPHLHVRDVGAALRFTLLHWEEMAGQVFNVVGENASVLDVTHALQKTRPTVEVRMTEQDMLSHRSYAVDGSRLNTLGWQPEVSLETGLAEMLEHFRNFNPTWT